MQCGTLTNQIFGFAAGSSASHQSREGFISSDDVSWNKECECRNGPDYNILLLAISRQEDAEKSSSFFRRQEAAKSLDLGSTLLPRQSTQRIHILQQFSSLQNADYSNAYIYSQTLLFKINNTVDIFTHILSQNYNPYNYFYRSHTPTVKSVDTIHHNWVIYPLAENPTK
jgi:hypothetical protein